MTIPDRTGTSPSNNPARRSTPRWQRAAVAVVGAVGALAVWVIASAVGDGPRVLMNGTVTPVGPVEVLLTAVLATLAGWALLALLERTTHHARRLWTATALVVLLASLAAPFGIGADTGSVTTLLLLHLVVGAIVIIGLRRTSHSRRTGSTP